MRILVPIILSCISMFLFNGCSSDAGKTKYQRIDELMQEAFIQHTFAGNILVADSGKILYQKSFGKANLKENTDSTQFFIASLSKPLTAIAALRLVEKGKLKLDDTLDKFIKTERKEVGQITIHQLLTHSSGIAEIIGREEHQNIDSLIKNATLAFPSGSKFAYSNSGFVVLKRVLEIASNEKFKAILKKEVFEPAEMNSSGVGGRETPKNLALGFKDAAQTKVATIDFPIENVEGAGSVFSTTNDLLSLHNALNTNRLLSNPMKAKMFSQQIPETYGYGWFVRERGGVWDVFWHKGDFPGYTSFISRRTQKNQVIVILGNVENLEIEDLENAVSKILKSR